MILAGEKHRVAKWVCDRIRDMDSPPEKDFEALGVVKDGRLIGGVIYNCYWEIAPGQHDIRVVIAGEPGWLTKASLRALFSYPFMQLNCVRMTALIARANKKSLDLNQRLGFKIEGCIRDGFGQGKDALVTGLLKAECRWIG